MREVVAGEIVCSKNAQSFPIDHITNGKKPSLIQRHVRGRGEGGVLHLPGAAPRRQDPQEGVQGDARKGGKFGGLADSCILVLKHWGFLVIYLCSDAAWTRRNLHAEAHLPMLRREREWLH